MADRETQKVEFKSEWRDEYLKVISAFANSNGGKLIIGVDDQGIICSIQGNCYTGFDFPYEKNILVSSGSKGAGAYYFLK